MSNGNRFTARTLLCLPLLTSLLLSSCGEIYPSHDQPWSPPGVESNAKAPDGELQNRIILIGDAGSSSLNPLEASLDHAIDIAGEHPQKTMAVMLGDNIYMQGFPRKESGQSEWDEDQLEDISHLDAQLEIARQADIEMVFVPGNHDWYATELDGQARHLASAAEQGLKVRLAPYQAGHPPKPEVVHRPGISVIFLDSQWMITRSDSELKMSENLLWQLVQRTVARYPDNILLLTAHHPLETVGPHAQYYTDRIYPAFIKAIGFFYKDVYQQDLHHEDYRRYMDSIDRVLADFPDSRVIFAAGHEHSLQAFGGANDRVPQYRLVSGSGSLDKVTGVGHNDKTLFAVAQQGFMAIDVHTDGALLRVYTSGDRQQVFSYRLW